MVHKAYKEIYSKYRCDVCPGIQHVFHCDLDENQLQHSVMLSRHNMKK